MRNTLIIPDLHFPFEHEKALEFVLSIKKKYKTKDVVFLGDILDSHFASYHETDPNGFGAGMELALAKKKIKEWYKAFPKAVITTGNHTRNFYRKAFSGGIPREVLKDMSVILETPKWEFKDNHVIEDIIFTHGDIGSAKTKCKKLGYSIVQGHYHTQSYIEFNKGYDKCTFAMQLGCLIDKNAYPFKYAGKLYQPQINCGVILGDTKTPIIEYLQT
jgi:metallophosphoesterase superfamily enzyme